MEKRNIIIYTCFVILKFFFNSKRLLYMRGHDRVMELAGEEIEDDDEDEDETIFEQEYVYH